MPKFGKDKPKPRVKDDKGMAAKSFKDFQKTLKPVKKGK